MNECCRGREFMRIMASRSYRQIAEQKYFVGRIARKVTAADNTITELFVEISMSLFSERACVFCFGFRQNKVRYTLGVFTKI